MLRGLARSASVASWPGVFGIETESCRDADAGGWRCPQSSPTKVSGNECLQLMQLMLLMVVMVVMVVGGAAVSGIAIGAIGRRSLGNEVGLGVESLTGE